jgi:alpha-1,3-rhamnosyl/mannosyltransferase
MFRNRWPLEETRDQVGFSARSGARILFVSHGAPHKGVDVLLHAFSRVLTRRPDAELWLTLAQSDWPVGFHRYNKLVRELGIESSVRWLGRIPQDAIGQVYEAANIFAFPSFCESFGYPMVEALSCRLPVVAADTNTNREVLGSAALFHPPGSSSLAATQLLRVACTPSVAKELADRAERRIREFDWSLERYAREFGEMIETAARTGQRQASLL